jgi:hypothetical protein
VRAVLAFGACWSVACSAVVLALPSVRAVTWRETSGGADRPRPA